jgi:DNA-damage-inducible protein D
LGKEDSQSVTDCHRLKLPTANGKQFLTDVATAETLLRLVQSVPSPKAEPIKLWLAQVGNVVIEYDTHRRSQEIIDEIAALDAESAELPANMRALP